jgi:hypothetical protein
MEMINFEDFVKIDLKLAKLLKQKKLKGQVKSLKQQLI